MSSERILIVERQPEWGSFLTSVLHSAGYMVALCHDVPSALEESMGRSTDLVLADASLPALIRLLAMEHKGMRFVVFTAAPSIVEALTMYRFGASDYRPKSFDPDSVLSLVRSVLRQRPVAAPRLLSPEPFQ